MIMFLFWWNISLKDCDLEIKGSDKKNEENFLKKKFISDLDLYGLEPETSKNRSNSDLLPHI